eukprot:295086_1
MNGITKKNGIFQIKDLKLDLNQILHQENGQYHQVVHNQGQPTNTYDPNGFYNCYMEFPIIYLTEDQMNDGILVVVDGQVGDFDDQFDNGPIWDYEFRFQQWTAEEVRAGVKESWGTRITTMLQEYRKNVKNSENVARMLQEYQEFHKNWNS